MLAADVKPLRARSRRAAMNDRSSLMNVGRRVDYALRAVCYLAAQGPERVVTRAEIETQQAVPTHFLSKILRTLVGAGLLESVPGARGGFRLGRPPEAISVRDVYESVEGRLCLIDCVKHGEGFCQFSPVCTQIGVWRGAQELLMNYLAGISIEQIADQIGLVTRLEQSGRRCAS
jgi:Rrf2 family protein